MSAIYQSNVSVRCTRQPPSLADSARHVLFNCTLHLDRFQFEMNTPYDLYVYAARSNRVSQTALLPPEAPMITIWYCNDIDSPFKVHRDCLGAGPWLNHSEWKYDSSEMMINDLIKYKNHFWCHHREKGLFFPIDCFDHADTVAGDVAPVEVEEDEEEEEGIAVL